MQNLWTLTRPVAPDTRVVLEGDTIPQMFWNGVAKRQDDVWLRQKELGIWRSWTWNQTGGAVSEIAHGLMALDFKAGQCASILANTVIEWVLADVAVMSAGGVSNGIYPTDAASQVHYLCEDSRTTILFVEDEEQLDKALAVRDRLPLLRKIVVIDMDGLRDLRDPGVISLKSLRELGRDHMQRHPRELQARVAAC